MKNLILALLVLSLFASCRQGCIDDKANNYETKAKKDDGSCLYDMPQVTLSIDLLYSGSSIDIDQEITRNDGRKFITETFRFYLSNIVLVDDNNQETTLADILLMNFDQSDTLYSSASSYTVSYGNYTKLKMDLGVAPELNATDPVIYEPRHPLSIYSQMHWGWTTKYIFCKMDGRFNDGGGVFNGAFFYHAGFDVYYKTIPTIELDLPVGFGVDGDINLQIDLYELFNNQKDPIDLLIEGQTHTSDNEELANRFLINLSEAIRLKN
jgi:hypothetical protein|tara:strand:- start:3358 stop:4158 length:801 start_codon:yes stop_codon:yes gene_type:complete